MLSRSGQPHTTQVWRSIAPRIRAYFFRYGLTADLAQIAVEHGQLLAGGADARPRQACSRRVERHITREDAGARELTEPLLRVENLRTSFATEAGLIRAVDGVDFELAPAATLGVVGESGSGKSVTALSIMGLLDERGRIEPGSSILFEGRELTKLGERELEQVRGNEISMIFQEPMTSLNPVYAVGEQIAEAVRLHEDVGGKEAMRARARRCSSSSASPRPARRLQRLPAPALGRHAPARDDRRWRSRATRSC